MENQKILSNPLAVLRGCALLLVYSLISFLYFHYSSHTSEGRAIEFFDIETSTYVFYFIVGLIISVWMARSTSFNKQVLKTTGILIVLDIVAWFIPVGFVTWGLAFLPALIFLLILFAIATIIYNLTRPLINKPAATVTVAILLFIILCPLVWLNYNDLSVKGVIIYKNNSMFDSIEECSAYIYPVRENDCKKDWTAMHDRWNLYERTKNINLDPSLKPVAGSNNYQYFPSENITDIKTGAGKIAKYGDKAVVKILSGVINGKTFDTVAMSQNYSGNKRETRSINLNTSVESYDSYALGVIGMKVGGIRKITFKTDGFWINGDMLVKNGDPVTYTIELVSLEK